MSTKAKAVFTNHPYTEGPKTEPIYLSEENIGQFIYPDFGLDYSDLNYVYASTEKMTVCSMEIGPGGFFDPPDFHPGDEMYYVLEGTITQFNPLTGQCIRVCAGESLLIPKGVMHSAYNFEETPLKVLAVIAPKIVEDQMFPTDTEREKNTFRSEKQEWFEHAGTVKEPQSHPSLDQLGNWPLSGETLRREKIIYHISEQRKLLAIHGQKHPVLLKFSVSNDFMDTGEYILPAGGVTCRHSDPITNQGQTVLFGVGSSPMTIYLPKTRETYILKHYDALYLPEHTAYQLVNYTGKAAHAFFAVTPK